MLNNLKNSLVRGFCFLALFCAFIAPLTNVTVHAQACADQTVKSVTCEAEELTKNKEIASGLRIAVIIFTLILIVAVAYFLIMLSASIFKIMKADDERLKYDAIEALKNIAIKLVASFGAMLILTIVLSVLSFVQGASLFKTILDSFFKWK
jgi:mannose/fructose/N-acetylgalactosamine-specific phosphotransferase system component IIC